MPFIRQLRKTIFFTPIIMQFSFSSLFFFKKLQLLMKNSFRRLNVHLLCWTIFEKQSLYWAMLRPGSNNIQVSQVSGRYPRHHLPPPGIPCRKLNQKQSSHNPGKGCWYPRHLLYSVSHIPIPETLSSFDFLHVKFKDVQGAVSPSLFLFLCLSRR